MFQLRDVHRVRWRHKVQQSIEIKDLSSVLQRQFAKLRAELNFLLSIVLMNRFIYSNRHIGSHLLHAEYLYSLIDLLLNVAVFWDIAPCSPNVNRRFGGTYHLHLRGLDGYEPATRWFLARLIFDPEDGGDTFLRNVYSQANCTPLYLRRWQHSKLPQWEPQVLQTSIHILIVFFCYEFPFYMKILFTFNFNKIEIKWCLLSFS
jgi:hypothetical protein